MKSYKCLIGKTLKTALVIEDDESLREFFVFDLEAAGFSALSAEDGEKATQILSTTEVDVVVSDINIPKKTGIEILQELRTRKDPSKPAVVLITGDSELRLEDAYHLGINLFLLKPFNRQYLIDSVKRLSCVTSERWLPENAKKLNAAWNSLGTMEISVESYEKAVQDKALRFGQGGLFITLSGDMPQPGEAIGFQITFENDQDHPIVGEGIVRWIRTASLNGMPTGIGVEILQMEPASIGTYAKILERDRPIAFIPKS